MAKVGPLLVVTEFRYRESQMPEDAATVIKQVEELMKVMEKQPGVSHVRLWASMNGPGGAMICAEVDSPETAMEMGKNPNPEIMGLMANLLRRIVIVERRTYIKPPLELVAQFAGRV